MAAYQALYRAWRPETFGDVCGQETVTSTLRHQIVSGRIAHAYLFCGSRGTGKTSTAKVLARAVNCKNTRDGEPCGECEVCVRLKNESSLDVLEIDAASNNGVDDVRLLRDRIAYPPTIGRYKVYIIDEVHMLSTSAFNALLKTLEEPPAHAVFILATTEPQKLPATVLSRCQRYDFRRISVKDIIQRMNTVLNGIGRECAPEALEEIAVAAEGGMRDALSLLDMCLSYTDGVVNAELVREVLGSTGHEFMFAFTDAIERGDAGKALELIDKAMRDGRDPMVFAKEVAYHMRTILMAQLIKTGLAEIAEITEESAREYYVQAQRFENARLVRAMDLFVRAEGEMRFVSMPRSVLEMCAVKACRVSQEKSVEGLTERIEALEKQIASGVVVKSAVPLKAEEKPAEKPEAKPEVKPIEKQEAADSPDKQAFETGLQAFTAKTPSAKAVTMSLTYLKTENDVVYAQMPVSKQILAKVLESKKAEIEAELSTAFGRPVKFNLTLKGSSPKQGTNGAQLNTLFEVFGRDKVEIEK